MFIIVGVIIIVVVFAIVGASQSTSQTNSSQINIDMSKLNIPPHIKKCPICEKDVSSEAALCPNCGHPINTTVKCPRCKSTNVKIISSASKTASILMVGVLAANKVLNKYECKACGHKFS